MLLQHIGGHLKDSGEKKVASDFLTKAREVADRARIVHDSVFKHERLSADLKYNKDMGKNRD